LRLATRDDFAEVGGIGARRVSCDRLREPNLDLLPQRWWQLSHEQRTDRSDFVRCAGAFGD
jgi:hypothetical protein